MGGGTRFEAKVSFVCPLYALLLPSYFAKLFVKAILFQLERFLEAGEPKLMDHHDWGQEETEETPKDKENNIEVDNFYLFWLI